MKQFRAVGRFTWIFYYSITVFAFHYAYLLYRALAIRGHVRRAHFLLVVLLTLQLTEGFFQAREVSRTIAAQSVPWGAGRVQRSGPLPEWIQLLETKPYQAILPLPYYHVGSVDFSYVSSPRSKVFSMLSSLQTGLSLMAVQLNRLPDHRRQVQMSVVRQDDRLPELMKAVDDRNVILLLTSHEPLKPEEKDPIELGRYLKGDENVVLYELDPDTLFGAQSSRQGKIRRRITKSCRETRPVALLPRKLIL